MTTPMIEIVNGNQAIRIPVAALVHFDQVVDLAHLCLLSVPVQSREAGAVEAAKQSIADAAASDDPMAALKALAAGVKKRQDSELTAEKLEPGQKPGEDPAKRLLEHVTKCAESLGIVPPKDTPIGAIVTAIAKFAAQREHENGIWSDTLTAALNICGIAPTEETGSAGLHKNLSLLTTNAKAFAYCDKTSATAVVDLHARLRAFGVEIQDRTNGTVAQNIDDASNAIGLAGRRGHKLAAKAPA